MSLFDLNTRKAEIDRINSPVIQPEPTDQPTKTMKNILPLIILTLFAFFWTGCQSFEDGIRDTFYTETPAADTAAVSVYQPKPLVNAAVTASSAVPIPYLETALSALLAAGATYFSGRKRLKTAELALDTTISAVEKIAKDVPSVKETVRKISEYTGTAEYIHKRVKKITI